VYEASFAECGIAAFMAVLGPFEDALDCVVKAAMASRHPSDWFKRCRDTVSKCMQAHMSEHDAWDTYVLCEIIKAHLEDVFLSLLECNALSAEAQHLQSAIDATQVVRNHLCHPNPLPNTGEIHQALRHMRTVLSAASSLADKLKMEKEKIEEIAGAIARIDACKLSERDGDTQEVDGGLFNKLLLLQLLVIFEREGNAALRRLLPKERRLLFASDKEYLVRRHTHARTHTHTQIHTSCRPACSWSTANPI